MQNSAYKINFRGIGQDVTIWPLAKIVNPEMVTIGNSVIIDDFVLLMGGNNTSIESFVHIASFTSITGGGEFLMEDFAGLSGGVRVYTGNEDYLGGSLTNPAVPYPYRIPQRSYVLIRKHAIIGANSVILPGVEIGAGAVVGANCLVTRNCDPWTIYVGSPAKPLRSRPKEKILRLEERLRDSLYDINGSYIPKKDRKELLNDK